MNFQKVLFQVSVHELHIETPKKHATDFSVAYYEKLIYCIIDYALQLLLPPQLRHMTQNHQTMRGCKIFIQFGTYQESLNHWRKQQQRYIKNHEN